MTKDPSGCWILCSWLKHSRCCVNLAQAKALALLISGIQIPDSILPLVYHERDSRTTSSVGFTDLNPTPRGLPQCKLWVSYIQDRTLYILRIRVLLYSVCDGSLYPRKEWSVHALEDLTGGIVIRTPMAKYTDDDVRILLQKHFGQNDPIICCRNKVTTQMIFLFKVFKGVCMTITSDHVKKCNLINNSCKLVSNPNTILLP